jgi:hypothetical protein
MRQYLTRTLEKGGIGTHLRLTPSLIAQGGGAAGENFCDTNDAPDYGDHRPEGILG